MKFFVKISNVNITNTLLFHCKKFSHFPNKNNSVFAIVISIYSLNRNTTDLLHFEAPAILMEVNNNSRERQIVAYQCGQ